jgi:DNA-binding response OmpR family regulator
MSELSELRRRPDRRQYPRGGRRDGDRVGFTPMIFLIHDEVAQRDACAFILLGARFSVVTFGTAQEAMRVGDSLRPDAIVVYQREWDAITVREQARFSGDPIPIIPWPARHESLIHALRLAFRVGES